MRGRSTNTGSRGSWDGSGFEYDHLKRPSLPRVSPKGRLSVDFAPFPLDEMAKLEMLALKAKLSNCSSDPRYSSQEDNGRFCAETGGTDGSVVVENNNNRNNHVFNAGSRDSLMENLSSEVILQRYTTATSSNLNQGFVFESAIQNSAKLPLDDDEKEIGGSRPSTPTDFPPCTSSPRERLSTSPTEVLLTPTRPRGWSLKTLGSRLKLGWIESSLWDCLDVLNGK